MDGLVENDHRRAQGGQRHIQTTARRGRLQLSGEVFQISVRRVSEELKEIVMETVRMCAVDDHVRDRQDLEEKPRSLTLVSS